MVNKGTKQTAEHIKNRLAKFKVHSGNFKKGHEVPKEWREKTSNSHKGKHLSPNSEFKNYDYGIVRSKRVNGGKRLVSHLIWCKENDLNRVPFAKEGVCLIHHVDGNRENNNINNLQLMTRDFHAKLHIGIMS
jgi:hypothetical protein